MSNNSLVINLCAHELRAMKNLNAVLYTKILLMNNNHSQKRRVSYRIVEDEKFAS